MRFSPRFPIRCGYCLRAGGGKECDLAELELDAMRMSAGGLGGGRGLLADLESDVGICWGRR